MLLASEDIKQNHNEQKERKSSRPPYPPPHPPSLPRTVSLSLSCASVCMYVCVFPSQCVCVCVCVCARVCVFIIVCVSAYICVHVCVPENVFRYAYTTLTKPEAFEVVQTVYRSTGLAVTILLWIQAGRIQHSHPKNSQDWHTAWGLHSNTKPTEATMCTLSPGHAGVRGKMTDPNKIINWRAMQPTGSGSCLRWSVEVLNTDYGNKNQGRDITQSIALA